MNDDEWKDANPPTKDFSNKGRAAIICIAAGVALGILALVGAKIRPVGLTVGTFAFMTGLGMLIRKQKLKADLKPALLVTAAGFLLLLTHPRFGYAAGFAVYFLIIGAIGLVVIGIGKALKLSWDLGRRS